MTAPRPAPRPFPPRILLVDDDPAARALAAREIGQDHPEARFVEAGSEAALAAALAGAAAAPFDLAVVERRLGWADGIAVFRRIRAALPHCPVVMFAATPGEEQAVAAVKAGLEDYIVKHPHQHARLRAAAAALLGRDGAAPAPLRPEAGCETLVKEVLHRVHNSLQAVIALLHMHARRAPGEEARRLLEELGRRIQVLALAQARLYRGADHRSLAFDAYLRDLAAAHAGLASRPEIRLEARGEPLRLPADLAVPLGLIANELLANALKHAFPGGRGGRVVVALAAEPGGRHAVLSVRDDGVGLAGAARPGGGSGIGSRLLRGLARQIGAELALVPRGDGPGTEGRVRFPLPAGGE
jgi:two-component sensor histidine kinase